MDTVLKLNREEGITIVLITHYMDEAVLADRVVVMDNGRIQLDSAPREVFADIDKIKSLGLDAPQSAQLVKSLGINETVLNAQECAELLFSRLK